MVIQKVVVFNIQRQIIRFARDLQRDAGFDICPRISYDIYLKLH